MLKSYFFYLFFIIISFSYSQIIFHKVIDKSDSETDIVIDALVTLPFSEIKNIKLYYKSEKQIKYLEQEMIHKGSGFYYGSIPSNYIMSDKIYYYILLELNDNKLYTFHTDQLRAVDEDQKRDKVDIHKSYPFFDED